MVLRVVVHTHPRYAVPFEIMMDSLDYENHLDDIVVSVADVPDDEAEGVVERYTTEYGLKHVVTSSQNIDELTAYVALGKAIEAGKFQREDMFLMLHDTCEAGRLFWSKLKEVERAVIGPEIKPITDASSSNPAVKMFKFSYPVMKSVPLNGYKGTMQFYTFAYINDRLVTMCNYKDDDKEKVFVGLLTSDFNLTQKEEYAIKFECPDVATIVKQLREAYMWFPIHNNFNIGIATGDFIIDCAYPAYDGIKFTKSEGIDVEINEENPLNLRNIAGDKWRYTHCAEDKTTRYPIMSLWQNDTDVYGDGKLRNVSYIQVLDLKKYSVLVGAIGNPIHPERS